MTRKPLVNGPAYGFLSKEDCDKIGGAIALKLRDCKSEDVRDRLSRILHYNGTTAVRPLRSEPGPLRRAWAAIDSICGEEADQEIKGKRP